jgi:hypothetical protein
MELAATPVAPSAGLVMVMAGAVVSPVVTVTGVAGTRLPTES